MGNETSILLYSKIAKHATRNDTPRHHSNLRNLLSGTGEHQRTLKEINRISKSYQNIRTTPAIMGNGTFVLLFPKFTKNPAGSDTSQDQSNSQNLDYETGKQ